MKRFANRHEAGRLLAARLAAYADRFDVIVLALPRGGVPVGYEVATALRIPLDVFIVRKLGAPWNEELAVGALASGGIRILNEKLIHSLGIPPDEIERITAFERAELERREQLYRGGRPFPDLHDRVVILVDDGLATGASMLAAVKAIREHSPSIIVVAVPVGSYEACSVLRSAANTCICLTVPEMLYGVGWSYADFSQTTDREVTALLQRAEQRLTPVQSPQVS